MLRETQRYQYPKSHTWITKAILSDLTHHAEQLLRDGPPLAVGLPGLGFSEKTTAGRSFNLIFFVVGSLSISCVEGLDSNFTPAKKCRTKPRWPSRILLTDDVLVNFLLQNILAAQAIRET